MAYLLAPTILVALAGCGAGGGAASGDGKTVNVLMVNNPQMLDLQKLTKEYFTKKTGITVNYTVLPENDLDSKVATEFSTQAGQYDVASVGPYQVPTYAKNGWLDNVDSIAKDASFDQSDIYPAMTKSLSQGGHLYAEPFYGESSFMMYRKDVFQKLGLTMPAHPTWQQVADLAAKVDAANVDGMKGICLRGEVGWGQIFAPLDTVINTFGGAWFDKDWNATFDSPATKEAVQFYVDLVKDHGEPDASQSSFPECLNDMEQGKVAMWYDATSAANSLEASSSPVAGKMGYAAAPVVKTKASGWLWNWAWAIEKASKHEDAAKKFITWASSKDYEKLVAEKLGGASVPDGKRASTIDIPQYKEATAAFNQQAQAALEAADPDDAGVAPRPTPGIQYLQFPEFADLATSVSQGISAAIAGKETVDQAVSDGQKLAEAISAKYQKK